MSWLRLDDGIAINAKLGVLTDSEHRALIALWSYCARKRNGGSFSLDELLQAVYTTPRGARNVQHCHVHRYVELGLVNTEDGVVFSVNDWASYQPKDPTSAERKRRWRDEHE